MMIAAAGVGPVPVGSTAAGDGLGVGLGAGAGVLAEDEPSVVVQKVLLYAEGLGVAWLRMRKQYLVLDWRPPTSKAVSLTVGAGVMVVHPSSS